MTLACRRVSAWPRHFGWSSRRLVKLLKLVAELPEADPQQLGGVICTPPARSSAGCMYRCSMRSASPPGRCPRRAAPAADRGGRAAGGGWPAAPQAPAARSPQHDRALDDVLQLTDVARPVVLLEHGQGLRRHAPPGRPTCAGFLMKWATSSGMSSRRSRSGGRWSGMTLRR